MYEGVGIFMVKTKKMPQRAAKGVSRDVTEWSTEDVEVLELARRGVECEIESKWKLPQVMCGALLLLGLFGAGIYVIIDSNNFDHYRVDQAQILEKAEAELGGFYQDEAKEVPVRALKQERIVEFEENLELITFEEYQEDKNDMQEKSQELQEFVRVRDKVDECFEGDEVLKSGMEIQRIEDIILAYQQLPEGHQGVLREKVEKMLPQYEEMQNVEAEVRGMFEDEGLEKVRGDLKRVDYNAVKERLEALPQQDVREKWKEKIAQVEKELSDREAELRRLAEEERRKREEERRRREAEIAAAWHIINTPYHSQNLQAIYNGCEAASLLMGLQAKGYLGGMNLSTYVEMIPKSDDGDASKGFTHSIYDLEPKDVPHWIMPGPLAAFGRSSAGANVVDITGASLDQLDAEVAAGNPVIIYLTYLYKAPGSWIEGAPKNIHVQLLTGFNAVTGEQIITDPWTNSENSGNGKRYRSRALIEGIYNASGRRAVVIR